MLAIITALWPVFALLLLGHLARRFDFPGAGFWAPAEKATYYVFFPALLVSRLAQSELTGGASLSLVAAVLLLLGAGVLICLLLKPVLGLAAPAYTSFFQGAMRFNTYVALAATAALYGDAGIVHAAIITAVMIPMLNLLCVLAFSSLATQRAGVRRVLRTLATNPLILSCLLGISLSLTGLGLPVWVGSVLDLLARMALPLGLLAVGAGLSVRSLHGSWRALGWSSGIKLLLFPLLALGAAGLMELETLATQVLLLFAAVPTATSAYILARQLGGDADLMAAIITLQTLLAMLSLPLVLVLVV